VTFLRQKMREAEVLQKIEAERARLRQKATQMAGKTSEGDPIIGGGPVATTEGGKSRDAVADQVGLGSGRTYDRAHLRQKEAGEEYGAGHPKEELEHNCAQADRAPQTRATSGG